MRLKKPSQNSNLDAVIQKHLAEKDHLFFTRMFFKHRQNMKFRVNWHHRLICDVVQDVIEGRKKNVVINVSPGSSKTEIVVINLIARGLALNPQARFLHLSYSDDLALLNSQTARDIIRSDEYQTLWPIEISEDTKSKKRWNVKVDGKIAGGVYATSLAGQVTGFRAGHMEPGWQGCIILDDPLRPEDSFSPTKVTHANRRLITTVKSRKANPETPIILIMQRLSQEDPSGFIKAENLGPDWHHMIIPAILDEKYVSELDPKYQSLIERDAEGRFSYWPYKEPIHELLRMEKGEGQDQVGSRINRHVFSSQYLQNPVAIGGNLIRSEWFKTYSVLPKMKYRKIYADTAMKTAERNDFSVFECWGLGEDHRIYLIDLLRGKYEAHDLKRRAEAFWNKHQALDREFFGQLRGMIVEDLSSGTGLIQSIKSSLSIPIKGILRTKDKLSRMMDVVGYIESGKVCVPESAPYLHDFLTECEAFTADDSHAHDDQLDPMIDAINDLLTSQNKIEQWKKLI